MIQNHGNDLLIWHLMLSPTRTLLSFIASEGSKRLSSRLRAFWFFEERVLNMAKPRFNLDVVKALASQRRYRITKSRAMTHLANHCGSHLRAKRFALSQIASLEPSQYKCSTVQQFDQVFDVYEILADDILWYVKFTIDIDENGEEYLLILSFHP